MTRATSGETQGKLWRIVCRANPFGEPLEDQAISVGQPENIPDLGSAKLDADDYAMLEGALSGDEKKASDAIRKAEAKLQVDPLATGYAKAVGHVLKHDRRAT